MRLLGIGGAHVDRRGHITGEFVPGASNPGTMREDIGGGALNALRSAAQRGIDCMLVSIRGGDSGGERVARTIAEAGIVDMSATFLDRATSSYTALLDRHGDLIAGFADMSLYDLAFPKQLRRSSIRDAFAVHDAVLCDANVPAAGLERIERMARGKPLYAIAVSPAKVVRLRGVLRGLSCLFMNVREAAALAGGLQTSPQDAAAAIHALGLRAGVITAGGETVTVFEGNAIFMLQPPRPVHVADVTGAGDALAGTTVAALMRGLALPIAVREGVAASMLALECTDAVPRLEKAAFNAQLALVPDPRPVA
ncbi:MAG: carbohydrate kinase family protein [Rhizobiaceae bacterium]|nr:carbohydrate kinase family protein [Rhizobiaceae bacterium]